MALALRKRSLIKDSMSCCSCSCDKIPVKSNLRKMFGSQFKETVHCGEKDMKAGGWSLPLCSIHSREEVNAGKYSARLSSFLMQKPPNHQMELLTYMLLPPVKLETCPEEYLLGDCRSCHLKQHRAPRGDVSVF